MYIGQTGDQLNNRFNRHRSDIRCHQGRCELSKQLHNNDCDFEKDLKTSILEKNKRLRSQKTV